MLILRYGVYSIKLFKKTEALPIPMPDFEKKEFLEHIIDKKLGLEKEIGSLEKNKSADMIAVDLSHYFTQPIYNIFSLLVYAVNRFQVSDAWIKGKCLLEKGELKTIDVEKILTELNCWTSEIKRFSA